ncbi:B3 DNA binding domain containing protein [Trema orientale]|uniref:B3 DNA binding domain containing protein n=1 Tax=Trema orientale TaxID=63057 RepID=A0A2P5FMY3_TREOI|nr:B3 DNA binding domain containing protein [Trema orientale]
MGESCLDCSKWAEEIYWAHFQDIHFSQFMLSGFDQQLAIPKKFSNNLKKKLPEFVSLKGPGGGTWRVGVATNDDSLFFKHGWHEFASDHGLAENDLLVFKYSGESHFGVLIFDGQTLCEKEFSYFVKRCGHKRDDHGGNLTKRKSRGTSCDEPNNASSENVGCTSVEKSRDDDSIWVPPGEPVVTPNPEKKICRKSTVNSLLISSDDDGIMVPSGEPVITPTADEQVRGRATSIRPIRATRRRHAASNGSPPCSGELVSISDADHTPTKRIGTVYGMQYVSNRRPVSEDEKDYALQLAQAEISEPNSQGLLVIMKPSHVYTRFYVLLPNEWVMKYISLENQDLYLRFGDKEWRTRFNYNRRRRSAGLTSGWNHFAVDNNLEEFDVCVFEPGSPVNNSFCLDVKIFRVVEEMTPPTAVAFSNIRK